MAGQRTLNRKKFLTTSALTLATAGLMVVPVAAHADDHAWVLQNGGGSFSTDTSVNNLTTITQTTDRAIGIGNTSISLNQAVNIIQNNSGSLFVARDNTGNASAILGRLSANGGVIVLNQNGVIFGKGAVIDVGSIVASTGDINDAAFMGGASKLELTNFGDASVVNNGTVTVSGAGLAAFVAPSVVNNGIIQAKLGKVALAGGGEKATVDLYGDGLIELTLGNAQTKALAENAGTIEGKTVLMTAAAAKDVVDTVINMSGVIKATSVTETGGKIVLNGGGAGKVKVTGTVDASGATGGGSVTVAGHDIEIGGGALLAANADAMGKGGTVTIIADNNAILEGSVYAMGGALSGDGGFVELSAKNQLGYDGSVSTYAANGISGTFLIDPTVAVIHSGSLNSSTGADPFYISSTKLANDLGTNATVTVQATNHIDVGTDASVTNVGNGAIDVSTTSVTTYTPDLPSHASACAGPAASTNPHCTAHTTTVVTNGNLVLDSGVVNFNKALTMGAGSLTVNAATINLFDKIYGRAAVGGSASLLSDARLIGTAAVATVNVKSSNALIQQGINFADDSAAVTDVNVAAGTYNENLTINKFIALNGAKSGVNGNDVSRGAGETIVNGTGTSQTIDVTANGVKIDGITVDGQSHSGQTGIYVAGASNVTVQNTIVKNAVYGIYAYTAGAATTGLEIKNNKVAASLHGLDLNKTTGAIVSGNTVANGGGIFADNAASIAVTGNAVYNTNSDGIHITNSAGADVENNNVGLDLNGVSPSGTGANIGIGGGTYNNGIYVAGSNNVVIRNNASGHTNNGDGIKLENETNATVDGNTVDQAGRVGIYGNNVTASSFTNNTLTNGHLTGYGAISFDNGANLNVSLNTITGNDGNGIQFNGTGGTTTVKQNTVDSANTALNLQGSGSADVENNFFSTGAAGTGAAIGGGYSAVKIYDNSFAGYGAGHKAIANAGGTVAVADLNWFGTNDDNAITAEISGSVDFSTYLWDGTDTDLVTKGFQGGFNHLGVTNSGAQTGTGGRIQDAIDVVTDGGNVDVGAGTYVENLTIGKALKLTGHDATVQAAHAGNLVTVTAADVNIDPFVFDGLGIASDGLNATGANGLIVDGNTFKNFLHDGISVSNSSTIQLINNTVQTVGHDGIVINGGTGNAVANNAVKDSGNDGIEVINSNGAIIGGTDLATGNRVDGSGFDGISTQGGDGVQVVYNTVTNSHGASGVAIHSTTNAVVDHNDIQTSHLLGVYAQFADGIKITDNAVTSAGQAFSSYSNYGTGIGVEGTRGVTITGNTVTGATGDGINAGYTINLGQPGSLDTDVTIDGNIVSGTTGDGIKVAAGASSISGNTVDSTGADGIAVAASPDVVIADNLVGTLGGAHTIHGDGIQVDASNGAKITGNTVSNTQSMYFDNGSGIFVKNSNGVTIGGAGLLANTVSNIDWDGIKLANEDDATVDGNTVDGVTRVGIYGGNVTNSTIKNNIVKNGHLSGYGEISTDGGSNLSITGNTVTLGSDAGIRMNGATGTNLIDDNHIDTVDGDGIVALGVSNLSITHNHTTGAGANGIHVVGGSNETVAHNTVNGAGSNGILVYGLGGDTLISHNTVKGLLGTDGINVILTNNAVISGNDVTGGLTGIEIAGSNDADVKNNTVRKSSVDGILISGSTGATVRGNTIKNTGADGIHATGGVLKASDNTIDKTGGDGIDIANSEGVKITGNLIGTLAGNIHGDGIVLRGSDNAILQGNTINDTISIADATGSGIQILNSDGVLVGGNGEGDANTISNIGWDGIRVADGSDDIRVIGNAITDVTRTGVYLGGVNTGKVKNNTIAGANNYFGIDIGGGQDITVSHNTVDTTALSGINANGVLNIDVIGNDVGLNGGDNNIGGDGISVLNSTNVNVNDNTVANAQGNGIYVDPSFNVTVDGNDVSRVGQDGILVDGFDTATITNNTVGFTGNDGIAAKHGGGVLIDGNTVYLTGRDGIFTRKVRHVTVTGNDVYLTGADGIALEKGKTAYIAGNLVLAAGWDGISVSDVYGRDGADGYSVQILDNKIALTQRHGINVDGASATMIDGNQIALAGTNVKGWLADIFGSEGGTFTLNWGNGDGIHVENVYRNARGGSSERIAEANNAVSVRITNNDVKWVGGDGVEVRDSGSARISRNTIDQTGINSWTFSEENLFAQLYDLDLETVIADGENALFGDGNLVDFLAGVLPTPDEVGYGTGDGIHVANVGGDFSGGFYEGSVDVSALDRSAFDVRIVGNDVTNTGGDGIDVRDSGWSRIANNKVDATGLNTWNFVDTFEGDDFEDREDNAGDGIRVSNGDFYGTSVTKISGNKVTHTGNDGIEVFAVDNSLIDSNKVKHTGANGILVTNDRYADPTVVTNNIVANTGWDGIHVEGVDDVTVADNTIWNTGENGIAVYNAWNTASITGNYVGAARLTGDGEEQTSLGGGYIGWDGIRVDGAGQAQILSNTVDMTGHDGIEASNVGGRIRVLKTLSEEDGPTEPTYALTIADNDVSNAGQYGHGETTFSLFSAKTKDVGGSGIHVYSNGPTLIDTNRVINSAANGIYASGQYNTSVVLVGNTLTDNPVGGRFESGMIDLTGKANKIIGGDVGLQFEPFQWVTYTGGEPIVTEIQIPDGEGGFITMSMPGGFTPVVETTIAADLNLVDNTIGTTEFTGQSTYYVELRNGALFNPGTPTIENGLNASYDGFSPASVGGLLTQAQYDAIEAKIYHYRDDTTLGLFFFGVVPENINQKDLFRLFGGFGGGASRFRLTILGLPKLGGNGNFNGGNIVNLLASLAPAAGGDDNGPANVDDIAGIEPAAGGNAGGQTNDASCWSQAVAAASGGAAVNYSFGGSMEESLAQAAACGNGSQF